MDSNILKSLPIILPSIKSKIRGTYSSQCRQEIGQYQLQVELGAGGLEQLDDGGEVAAVVAEQLVGVIQDLESIGS